MLDTSSFLNQMNQIELEYKDNLHYDSVDVNNSFIINEQMTVSDMKTEIETIIKANNVHELDMILQLISKTTDIIQVSSKIDLYFYILIRISIEYNVPSHVMFPINSSTDNRFIVDTCIQQIKLLKSTSLMVDYLVNSSINNEEDTQLDTTVKTQFNKDFNNTSTELPINLLRDNNVISEPQINFILYYDMIKKQNVIKNTEKYIEELITIDYIEDLLDITDINQIPIIQYTAKQLLLNKVKLTSIYTDLLRIINEKV